MALHTRQIVAASDPLGLDPFYQQIALGVILLLAVGTDAWTRRFD